MLKLVIVLIVLIVIVLIVLYLETDINGRIFMNEFLRIRRLIDAKIVDFDAQEAIVLIISHALMYIKEFLQKLDLDLN